MQSCIQNTIKSPTSLYGLVVIHTLMQVLRVELTVYVVAQVPNFYQVQMQMAVCNVK